MALMYPWATKEYLLWEMTIGQIILYHNKGIQIKNGITEESKSNSLVNMELDELKRLRDESRAQFEAEREAAKREELRKKYGEIDG